MLFLFGTDMSSRMYPILVPSAAWGRVQPTPPKTLVGGGVFLVIQPLVLDLGFSLLFSRGFYRINKQKSGGKGYLSSSKLIFIYRQQWYEFCCQCVFWDGRYQIQPWYLQRNVNLTDVFSGSWVASFLMGTTRQQPTWDNHSIVILINTVNTQF